MPSDAPANMRKLSADLSSGQVSARQLVDECLARIADPAGEGSTTFLKVHEASAHETADHYDRLRKLGVAVPPFAGIPISIKDLFDLAGESTAAGSKVLASAPHAARDAPAVARMRAAGFIPVGRTNMSEFAFSGLGFNPHFGTPRNPWDRSAGRIPGGSSSGAAISVTDGMACAALGTDTGGSCRIPAALTGIVGWKPTARRISLNGVLPLAPSLDSVGTLAASVDDCAIVDAILADEEIETAPKSRPLRGVRFAVPETLALDDIDDHVSRAFDLAIQRLSRSGAIIEHVTLPELAEIQIINAKGGFPAAEAYAWHRPIIRDKAELYDPRVLTRIKRGAEQDAADYITLCRRRADWILRVTARLESFDALLMPTVPNVAPLLSEIDEDADFTRLNLRMLRNSTIINMLDGCAISLPCSEPNEAPVGLTIAGLALRDHTLFAIARSVEVAVNGQAVQDH
jgi:aspartyl-tRNA(Asn)/glutamyl-tRNA(Gln) amidotransferase subunit A